MRKATKKIITVYCAIAGVIGILIIFLCIHQNKDEKKIEIAELPKIEIILGEGDLETIEKDKTITYGGNEVIAFDNGEKKEFYDVEIKGHGNSTWENDKKPYQLRFKNKVDLLGNGRIKKWILIANRFDASQLRTSVAFFLGEMLGMDYMMGGDYIELVIDGDYRGLYYLIPKIEISKSVVDLRSSLGVIVELDNLHGTEKGCYYSGEKMCLVASDLVDNANKEVAMQDFVENFSKLEEAAEENDYNVIEKIIDVESFAKYFILSEFTVNPDSYASSWYMYKDGFNDKIHAGPGWDYDFAFGNHNWIWNSDESFYSPELDMVRETDAMGSKFYLDGELIEKKPDYSISRVMIRLMKIPQFREEVEKVFRETLSGRKMELLAYIKIQADRINSALLRDDDRWGQSDYQAETEYLIDWIDKRYDHFEKTYGSEEGIFTVFQ